DRRRGEGVGDRDGLAAAVDAGRDQARLAVSLLVLLRDVAAHRVRLVLAVRLRLVRRGLLPVVVRAGLHAVAGAVRRTGQGVGVRVDLRALIDAEDAV